MAIDNYRWLAGVITVGNGRGFVVGRPKSRRYVITAAQCLPFLPTATAAFSANQSTYSGLLGPLGGNRTVASECHFVDPIANIAVLGCPQEWESDDAAVAYIALTDAAVPLPITDLPYYQREGEYLRERTPGWLLSLENRWFRCDVTEVAGMGVCINNAEEEIKNGMIGAPIVIDNGSAIGSLCIAPEDTGQAVWWGRYCPSLIGDLPARLLGDIVKWSHDPITLSQLREGSPWS
jgi:hypothetical protein